jgi:hypothetical protein
MVEIRNLSVQLELETKEGKQRRKQPIKPFKLRQ